MTARWLLVPLAVTLPIAGVVACSGSGGRSHGQTTSAASITAAPASHQGYPVDADEDNDNPVKSRYDGDDEDVVHFGHPASDAERHAVVLLLTRYYRALAAGDGATACSLLYRVLAEGVPEDYGQASGSSEEGTCASVITRLFRRQRRTLAAHATTLRAVAVSVDGDRGWALVRFGGPTERTVKLHREDGAWKIDVLLDAKLP